MCLEIDATNHTRLVNKKIAILYFLVFYVLTLLMCR
jgi:hypothetical protein